MNNKKNINNTKNTMKNNKKVSKTEKTTKKYEQSYLQLGLGLDSKMGFNPNLTKNNFGHNFTKQDMDLLGGYYNKQGILTVGVVIDDITWDKFGFDKNTRGESMMFRFACIVLNKYPKLTSAMPFSSLSGNCLLTNTDFLKRSGFGKLNNAKRNLHLFQFKGKYKELYGYLVKLCYELHVTMGTLIGMIVEDAYLNYNKPKVMFREVVELERISAADFMGTDRGKTDWRYGMGMVVDAPTGELEKIQKGVIKGCKMIKTRISQICNRKRKVVNVNLNSVKMQSKQTAIRMVDMAVKLEK